MPRTVSQETIQKLEFVKGLHAADKSITRRELNEAVKKKFKTGLAFGHMANVLEGGRRRRERPGARQAPGSSRLRSGKGGGLGRLEPVSDRIFAGSPPFLVIVGGERSLRVRAADSKATVKDVIARLVSAGTSPGHIRVYSRDAFSVETRPIVSMD